MIGDSQLQSDVQAGLGGQPRVNAAHIGAMARDGVVTLTGQVTNYAEKIAAEDTTKKVYGVKAVANDIVVELPGSSERTDADIAAAALSAMESDFTVPSDRVQVTVHDGWIMLEGTVDWQFQRDAARHCVDYLAGVKGVINSIVIEPPQGSPGEVESKIEDALRRHADLDARRIAVVVGRGSARKDQANGEEDVV